MSLAGRNFVWGFNPLKQKGVIGSIVVGLYQSLTEKS
jgi:hypothetical protein